MYWFEYTTLVHILFSFALLIVKQIPIKIVIDPLSKHNGW